MTDETGQPWPASEIARALCDCTLTRAVIGTKDADLNLGRQSRLFRRQHWLALYAAGITSCAIAACTIPLAYTELHHLQWWYQHAGRTDLTNCAPYCSYHHHQIHRLGIQIRRRADGTLEHQHPDGRPYGDADPPDAGLTAEAGGATARPHPADAGTDQADWNAGEVPDREDLVRAAPRPRGPNPAGSNAVVSNTVVSNAVVSNADGSNALGSNPAGPNPPDRCGPPLNAALRHGGAASGLPAEPDPVPAQGTLFAA